MTSTCLFLKGQNRRKVLGHARVFCQRISILTVDFNTSLAVSLTDVSALESFTLILFFPEPRSHVWFGAANVSRGSQLQRVHLLSLVVLLFGQQRWNSEHGISSPGFCGNSCVWCTCASIWMALSISAILYPFYFLRVSVSVWNDTEKIRMFLRKC